MRAYIYTLSPQGKLVYRQHTQGLYSNRESNLSLPEQSVILPSRKMKTLSSVAAYIKVNPSAAYLETLFSELREKMRHKTHTCDTDIARRRRRESR